MPDRINGEFSRLSKAFQRRGFGRLPVDVELAAVITYTRNAWGNKAEDNIVQPAEVMAARK